MESTPSLNPDLVTRSLNFHGQLLQKSWEGERGEGDLQKQGVSNLDFEVYSQRQKHLSFQDRGKRLKLHQFISKRADILFDSSLIDKQEPKSPLTDPGLFAVMPSFESFLNLDKSSRTQHFLQCLRVGDVIVSSISNKANSGIFLKVLCLDGENGRSVSDLNIKAFCPTSNLISAIDKKNVPRTFMLNDLVACEVLEVIPDSEKIICGMKGIHSSEHKKQLGLFHSDDFPESYKLSVEGKTDTYEAMLEKTLGFHNPSNVVCLSDQMGLGNVHHTNILGLKGRFPEAEYANELRQVQAGRWALKSVTEGVEHFKAGRKTEAFQCLNRALTIDSNNIEGIVARGALYANSGSFKKAIDDFEAALKINPTHANARSYISETLVAYGRSFEDAHNYDEALKCYEKCLEIVPYHEEALSSCEFMRSKLSKVKNGGGSLTDGLVTGLSITKAQGVKDTLKQLLGNEQSAAHKDEPSSAKKKKKEKKAKKHKRSHSSSSSDSSSSGSSSSSSSSSSSDSSSASSNDSGKKKKHKSRKNEPKEKSLSPLSKRMAIMDSSSSAITEGQRGSHYNPPALPFSFQSEQVSAAATYPASIKSDKESEYEQRVCKFLEQTKGDSDYEEKVRKFLDETAKWKKERKAYEEKAKKKRKKEKKANKKNKKKKREERKKKKMMKELEDSKKIRDALRKQRRRSLLDEDEEFMYSDKTDLRLSLPALEDLQSKLSYFVKAEKGSSKKKEKSVEKLVAAAQMKAKASSPKKVLYLPEDEEDEESDSRVRKSVDKKKMDMFEEPSPPTRMPDAKNVPLPSAPPPPSSKFKMNIGPGQNRLKKPREKSNEKDNWDSDGDKRFIYMSERERMSESLPPKEPENKKPAEKKVEEQLAKTPMVLDKLGGFRINTINAEKLAENERNAPLKRKLRPRVSDSDTSDSDVAAKKKERQNRSPGSSRSRSRSRSRKKYSSDSPPPKKYSSSSSRSPSYRKDRSRSKSGSYRSRSGRRYRSSESGSYRSRSRSRSRSMDYHRRSRSRSDDRHHYRKYPGHYPRNRGTYYRPRFQTGFKTRPGGFFPRGRGPWRPGGRPFIPRMRGRGRPRFFHNNYKPRDDRYRRYERDMSRSDDDDGSPMRKVDAAKERIDRMLGESKRHSGPLSEGEERDDDYMDRRERSGSPDVKKEGAKDGKKPNPW